MIPFNRPAVTGKEAGNINEVIKKNKFAGDGEYTRLCSRWLEEKFSCPRVLLTTSCTHALEICAILADIREGDEVIMPSFTFTSTANSFVMRGARLVFVDVRPDTMNMDEECVRAAVSDKTRAIVPVHYGGVVCEMDSIADAAKGRKIHVIEDAAQAILSTYKGRSAGTIGDLGTFSFHETKNIQCGEGGALLVNREDYVENAEIIREKGTNRAKFFRGEIDKYGWVSLGSSYLPSELNAAFLYAQLEEAEKIIADRMNTWNMYHDAFADLEKEGRITRPVVPGECVHNAHLYYIKVADLNERTALIDFLKSREVYSVFHYIPLHSSIAGRQFGYFHGEDVWTTRESERLLRLPLWYGMKKDEVLSVIDKVKEFFMQ
ncbi:MAG TPA: dTDP-4-amino-4,6-dideoxygalactose transaminase [Spirochaetota bacterium]|nr:dTDP-4-amino-4,6-dideoxygalactose transaminase [Spirochaetota bacterium]